MTESTGNKQATIDQANIEIIENSQATQTDITVIDQAEEKELNRPVNLKIAKKYLDDREYDLERITAEVRIYFEHIAQGYVAVGRLLLVVKQMEGYGGYMKWLNDNFQLSPRTAQMYTQVAMAIEQRPDLAPLAKGGISKAIVLLNMPEEYLDECEQEGTIAGRPLDEFQTMTRKELTAEIKRLQNDKEKIVAEETKGLKAENNALVEENKRLRKFEPAEDTTPEWCLEHVNRINQAALDIVTLCNRFVYDDRLVGDPITQAHIEKNIDMAEKAIQYFSREWNMKFNQAD